MLPRNPERATADHLISTNNSTVNCIGYAFFEAGLTNRKGFIYTRGLAGFEDLEEVEPERATFAAVVIGPGKSIYHIGYIDPRDRRYVLHTFPYKTPRRETVEDAMNPTLNGGTQDNPELKRELVYLGVKENNHANLRR